VTEQWRTDDSCCRYSFGLCGWLKTRHPKSEAPYKMLPLGHGLEQILWNQLSNGKWTWDLEDEISAMFIENNSKRTVEEYLLFWGKKNVKWNNRKWKKLNKLWQNF